MNANNLKMAHPDVPSQKELFFNAAQQYREFKLANNRLRVGENPRKFTRELRSISVSVEPLSKSLKSLGEPVWVITRDLSANGMGVISQDPIGHTFVKIGLPDGSSAVIGRVCHNTPVGSEGLLYVIGIEFFDGHSFE